MLKRLPIVIIILLSISGCFSQGDELTFNSGRTNTEQIQSTFRESILSRYKEPEQKEDLEVAEIVSPTDVNYQVADVTPELRAWRSEIDQTWKDMDEKKLNIMCELFFQGIVEESSRFGKNFAQVRERFAQEGTKIYSIKNIRLAEDNRKTIQFPTANSSSALFVCQSLVTLELTNGGTSQPIQSSISWIYYLDGNERKQTFNFKLKSQ